MVKKIGMVKEMDCHFSFGIGFIRCIFSTSSTVGNDVVFCGFAFLHGLIVLCAMVVKEGKKGWKSSRVSIFKYVYVSGSE